MRSNIIEEFLANITPEERAANEKRIGKFLEYQDELKSLGKKYNTDTSVSLDHLRDNGFNPIAITQMYLEETFVFNTKEEADKGFELLERGKSLVTGWWYEKEEFLATYKKYEEEMGYAPHIYYLDGWK